MTYKLNIIDPWDSGTESAVNVNLVKETGDQFLLFLEAPIKVGGKNAQYFICELRRHQDKNAFRLQIKGTYPINIVFDENIINSEDNVLPSINTYRSNFLLGEIII